ncbi:CobW family GTP-binding protein [Bordetella petrii]|uniref:CobW family GTP-binding protein n=1 Tax=Bordetella petrii TaxID=94624 RepID=UPI001E2BA06C|nr:GTP-binding protein [Bordetella petrii]MCD0503765.1 GTP-binding protein [Bordetella petrii]
MQKNSLSGGDSPDRRIGVTVLTGFLGAGKTSLLNRLVQDPAYADAAVIVNEFGEVGVDHHLVRQADARIILIEGGCICCTVNGGLVNTLRDLFMLALRRQVKPFRRVVIETTGLASPAAILFTLRHEHFLAERYVYRGTITVVDARHIPGQLESQPEAVQQVALADIIACTKSDLVDPSALARARDAVAQVNPGAAICVQPLGAPLDARLLAPAKVSVRAYGDSLSGWMRAFSASSPAGRHGQVVQVVVALPAPISRAAFHSGMARLQEVHHQALLRIKGLVVFPGESGPCAIHGVHRDLYPPVPLPAWPEGVAESRLVFIARGLDPGELGRAVRQALGLPE